jgi:serine/threonine-protein phosphatase PP1 catalytic subunit
MSVSSELLCSFELLKPLDTSALKSHIKKGRNKRNSLVNSPVSFRHTPFDLFGRRYEKVVLIMLLACELQSPERVMNAFRWCMFMLRYVSIRTFDSPLNIRQDWCIWHEMP